LQDRFFPFGSNDKNPGIQARWELDIAGYIESHISADLLEKPQTFQPPEKLMSYFVLFSVLRGFFHGFGCGI
jgi:hypothetical protein